MRRELNHVCGAALLALCSPLASYLVSFPTPALPLGLLHMRLFAKMDSSAKEYDIYYGVMPTFSDPQGAFLLVWSWGGFLYLRSDRYGHFLCLLPQSSVPTSNCVLGLSGKTKLQSTLLDKLQLLSPEAHLSPASNLCERREILKVEQTGLDEGCQLRRQGNARGFGLIPRKPGG